jgi:hypothetical protein
MANHGNLFLVMSYFYYIRFYPDSSVTFIKDMIQKNCRGMEFPWAVSVLRNSEKFKFICTGSKIQFDSDFKNPFSPHIMGDDELKNVLSKIISKLHDFCF